jgi:hypothetical protein
MAMALLLILRAMAKKSQSFALRNLLKQAQRKFLAMVLDSPVWSVRAPAIKKLFPVTFGKISPGDLV